MEIPHAVRSIPCPNIRCGFDLVLRYLDRTERISFRDGRYRFKLLISRQDVAEMIGRAEDYLHGLEDAYANAAAWSDMKPEERRTWIND